MLKNNQFCGMGSLKIISLLLMLVLVSSCGMFYEEEPEYIYVEVTVNPEIPTGTYTTTCYLNRTETVAAGFNVYSISTFVLQVNNTGTNTHQDFSDPACTVLTTAGGNSIFNYEAGTVEGVVVARFSQDNGEFWYPFLQVDSANFYFDIDWSDLESGPYPVSPLFDEVQSFYFSPAIEGIFVTRVPL